MEQTKDKALKINAENLPRQKKTHIAYSRLIQIAKRLKEEHPEIYAGLNRDAALNHYEEIPDIISFLEDMEDLDTSTWGPWHFQLSGHENSTFFYLILGVVVSLYDTEFFIVHKNLRHGLRAAIEKYTDRKGSNISDRLKVLKGYLETDLFVAAKVNKYAKEYMDQRHKIKKLNY